MTSKQNQKPPNRINGQQTSWKDKKENLKVQKTPNFNSDPGDVEHREEILIPDNVVSGHIAASHEKKIKNEAGLGISVHLCPKTLVLQKQRKILLC